jgi:hypothetical protein
VRENFKVLVIKEDKFGACVAEGERVVSEVETWQGLDVTYLIDIRVFKLLRSEIFLNFLLSRSIILCCLSE